MRSLILSLALLLAPALADAHPEEFIENMTVEQTQTVAPMTSLSFLDTVVTFFEEDEWLFCDDDDFEPGDSLEDCDDIEEIDFPFEREDDPRQLLEATFFYTNNEAAFCNNCGAECDHTPFVGFFYESTNPTVFNGLFHFASFNPDAATGDNGRVMCTHVDIVFREDLGYWVYTCSHTGWGQLEDELLETGGLLLHTQSRVGICAYQNFRRFPLFEESEARISVTGPGWYHERHCGLLGLEVLLVPLAVVARRRCRRSS